MAEPTENRETPPRPGLAEAEVVERLRTGKVACLLVIVLMPVGISLDAFVYPTELVPFLTLRLACSALTTVLLALHFVDWQRRKYRLLGLPVHRLMGLPIALLPAFAIAWMIHRTEGIYSPYYAGLNLVVLAVSVVVRWDVWESILAVLSVSIMYTVACAFHPGIEGLFSTPEARKILFNNYYFLALTGIIVVAGNYYFNRLRQELSRVRDQLAQSEKMASLGQMSAGIIHEINNPLNYATSGLFALRKRSRHIPEDQRADYEETVTDVQDGINRVNNIVSNLRVFTHPMFTRTDSAALSEVGLAEVVGEAVRGLAHLAREPIKIMNSVASGQTALGDRQKLVQVIENLLRNSLDALSAKQFNGEIPTIWIEGRTEKDRSVLIVRDNGPGIRPEDRARIFDPFFTTKDVGKGMGLGLTVCLGIVQAFGGNISVTSEPGKFCEFLLEFRRKE